MEVVAKTEGLVIADFGARNVERLLSFLQVASETQRYLVLTPKDFLMLEYLNYATPEVPNPLRDPWLLMYVAPKDALMAGRPRSFFSARGKNSRC